MVSKISDGEVCHCLTSFPPFNTALASEIDKARCQELIQDCLTTWRSLFAARQRDLGRADDLELTFIQRNAFASWRRCYHQQSHLKEQAVKTRAFFLQKQAFSDWMIRCRKRKQEKWMDQQRLDVCRKAFTNWSVKTVRHRLLHRLEKQIIARQQLEISSKTIGKWVNRLVEIKSQMVSVVESRERGLLKNTFSKWSKRTLELGEYHSLMLSFRVVKDKEDLGRLFQFWRMSAERTASLREVGEALRVMQERRSLATALEQWRYRHREIEMAPKVSEGGHWVSLAYYRIMNGLNTKITFSLISLHIIRSIRCSNDETTSFSSRLFSSGKKQANDSLQSDFKQPNLNPKHGLSGEKLYPKLSD